MSGGHFDYLQYRISDIVDSIEAEIENATKPKPPKVVKEGVSIWEILGEGSRRYVFHESFHTYAQALEYYNKSINYKTIEQGEDYIIVEDNFTKSKYKVKYYTYEEYADGEYYPEYSEKTLEEFRKGIMKLKEAQVYAQRIDWLLSGDDGEDTFHKRLKQDLEKLKKENQQ